MYCRRVPGNTCRKEFKCVYTSLSDIHGIMNKSSHVIGWGVFIQWTGMDHWTTGMDHWTTGMDYWITGMDYWNMPVTSLKYQ